MNMEKKFDASSALFPQTAKKMVRKSGFLQGLIRNSDKIWRNLGALGSHFGVLSGLFRCPILSPFFIELKIHQKHCWMHLLLWIDWRMGEWVIYKLDMLLTSVMHVMVNNNPNLNKNNSYGLQTPPYLSKKVTTQRHPSMMGPLQQNVLTAFQELGANVSPVLRGSSDTLRQ